MGRFIRNIVLAFFFVLALIGCTTSYTYHFDAGTTARERALAEQAMAKWNAQTNQAHQHHADPKGQWRVTFVDAIDDTGNLDGLTCGDNTGPRCQADHWIRVRRGMADVRTQAILEHELGHAMGMEHAPEDPTAIMYPSSQEGTVEFSAQDLSICQAVGACPTPKSALVHK